RRSAAARSRTCVTATPSSATSSGASSGSRCRTTSAPSGRPPGRRPSRAIRRACSRSTPPPSARRPRERGRDAQTGSTEPDPRAGRAAGFEAPGAGRARGFVTRGRRPGIGAAERGGVMPVDALRCRVCEAEYPAVASGSCVRCFGPLEPVYDWEDVARRATRERIAAGPRSLWRYEALLPVPAPSDSAGAPGFTPLVAAPRLADALGVGEVWLKLDHTNPTHSFKDRVVAVAAAKAAELGTTTLACASTGNLGNAVAARAASSGMRSVVLYPRTVEPEKLLLTAVYGGEMYAVRGSYDDCSRMVV